MVEFLHSLMVYKDKSLGQLMQTLHVPRLLLELVQQHFMNVFLHNLVNKIFEDAFKSEDETYLKAVRRDGSSSSRATVMSRRSCWL